MLNIGPYTEAQSCLNCIVTLAIGTYCKIFVFQNCRLFETARGMFHNSLLGKHATYLHASVSHPYGNLNFLGNHRFSIADSLPFGWLVCAPVRRRTAQICDVLEKERADTRAGFPLTNG